MILREEELRIGERCKILSRLFAYARTEKDADWRIVAHRHLILAVIRHVERQLRNVLVVELLRLEFNEDMAFEYAMVEYEVDPFVDIVDENVLLLILKAESCPHLSNEVLEIVENSPLKIRFVPIPLRFQSKEFKELLTLYEEQRDKGESVYLDADDFADIADYYLSLDRPDLSMDTLAAGLSLHPDDEVLLIVLSATHIYQRKYDQAEAVLKTLDASNSDVLYQLAQLEYVKYGNVTKAEKMWREWMKLENGQEPSEQLRRESYIHIISSLIELRGTGQKDRVYDVEATRRWVREYIDTFSPLGEYDEDVQMADICRENDLADLMCEVITQVLVNPCLCSRNILTGVEKLCRSFHMLMPCSAMVKRILLYPNWNGS